MNISMPGIVRQVSKLPPIRALREAVYVRRFAGNAAGYWGAFGSFAEAVGAAPKTKAVGYDQPALAKMYRDRMERAMPSDYPVLFWMSKLLHPGIRVFDFGGHVGVTYHCFSRYLDYPSDLRWTVCDVPAVIAEGAELAKERGTAGQLAFTSRFDDADGCDLLLAAGSLQYVEEHVWTMLGRLNKKPKTLLLSKVPIHDGPTFVTIQGTGNAFHAYRLSNRAEFEAGVIGAGYRKVDEWTNGEQQCHVPFGGADIRAYTGYIFERTS